MRKLKLWQLVLVLTILSISSFKLIDYTAENLLLILGANTTTKEFKPVKDFWLLDKNMQSTYGGIKFNVNSLTGKVDAIIIAGQNYQSNGTKFYPCSSPLPYGVTLNDDTATLQKKLGIGQKLPGRNTMKYYMGDVAIEATYTDLKTGKISYIKFYNEIKPTVQIVQLTKETPKAVNKLEEKRRALEDKTFNTTPEVVLAKEKVPGSFKAAILSVFEAYRESNFAAIKGNEAKIHNFWNYKYTYSTRLKIPGEKFNLLYSFPFITSPLDFVSVIKESDSYDASFQTTYKEFEQKLLQNFPASDGWTASCIVNKESKTLSDLQFNNDRYGSIILDYSKSPKGRQILYLRFLLYSN